MILLSYKFTGALRFAGYYEEQKLVVDKNDDYEILNDAKVCPALIMI